MTFEHGAVEVALKAERLELDRAAAAAELGERLLLHGPILLAAARSMTLDDAEAEDLVQTTLEIALRTVHQLRDPGALRPWLLTIQAREAFRLTRRLRRLVRLDRTVHELAAPGAPRPTGSRSGVRSPPSRHACERQSCSIT